MTTMTVDQKGALKKAAWSSVFGLLGLGCLFVALFYEVTDPRIWELDKEYRQEFTSPLGEARRFTPQVAIPHVERAIRFLVKTPEYNAVILDNQQASDYHASLKEVLEHLKRAPEDATHQHASMRMLNHITSWGQGGTNFAPSSIQQVDDIPNKVVLYHFLLVVCGMVFLVLAYIPIWLSRRAKR